MSKDSRELKTALSKKKVLKSNVTKFKDKVNSKIEEADVSELTLFQNKIKTLSDDLNSIFNDIFCYCDDTDIDNYTTEQQDIQEDIDNIWLNINRKCNSKMILNESSQNVNTSNVQIPEVKLPKLNLPTFSGNLDEWISFYDLFKASVDNNTLLSDCQKLQYLKSVCKHEALKVIQSIPIADDNYKTALDLLKERYSNKRELINSLIKKLMNMPCMSDSSYSILQGVDIINECIRSLKVLKQDLDGFSDTLIVYIITEKLDKNTRCWWERSLQHEELGTIDKLLTFMKDHARTLQNSKFPTKDIKKVSYNKLTTLMSNNNLCLFCKELHPLYKCSKFLQLTVQKRIEFVRKNNLCFNCFSNQHQAKFCKNTNRCKICNYLHHSVLHIAKNSNPNSGAAKELPSDSSLSPNAAVFHPNIDITPKTTCTSTVLSSKNLTTSHNMPSMKQTLLCTALIKVIDSTGKIIMCRALLDSGSEASFISEDCLRLLSLEKNNSKAQVTCLGSFNAPTSGEVQLNFTPHFNTNIIFTTKAFVIKKITSNVPSVPIPVHIATSFNDLVLADPLFFESKPIDILLGVNVFFTMLKGDIIKRNENLPFAISSKLGWIISGNTFFGTHEQLTFSVNNINFTTNELVEKFWALDSVPEIKNSMSEVDKKCEEHFQNTHFRDETGRYVVKLPFKESPSCLGDSREVALRRFLSLEHRLEKNPETSKLYKEFMQEYIELNHMELVDNSVCPKMCYYIPHHHVMKESSTTTKLRVVFNASSKTSSGVSLNDILMVGPRIQQELFPILLRFRLFSIVISADIMKMFRQILINPTDRDFQRIFWRDSPDKPIDEYRLTTVTYGTTSAPFLATRSIRQLALDEANNFPFASKVALRDFYVDDLLSGSQTVEECKELVTQLTQMMEKGGFVLRKWTSNIPSVLECIPTESKNDCASMKICDDTGIKILGINWNPNEDYFVFSVSPIEEKSSFTKRDILSDLAKVFDPLGWLAPCIIYVKILIQNLWKISLSWDEPIPEEICHKWTLFRKELPLIEQLKIPRFVLLPNTTILDIHAFCDASEKAYCAVIYIKSISSDSEVKISLLTSKTRVAPLKVQSLPRLELCSALLLTNLLQAVLRYLDIPIRDIFAWTDSTVVLSWISSESYRWVPFVANRVEKIQSTRPDVKWRYISGKHNPADSATRGLFPTDFLKNKLWFNGPDWLYSEDSDINFLNENLVVNNDEILREERKNYKAATCTVESYEIFEKYSSWSKLRRIIALCLRFIQNCRSPPVNRITGFLSTEELRAATRVIVKKIQYSHFFEEISSLKSGKEISAHSKILSLTPFLDIEGLLRVGGRLKNAKIPESQKFPILLPKNCHITNLIIMHYHVNYLHAAQELLLSILRMQYWILSGRSEVRKIIHRCLPCVKNRGKIKTQLMGDLPASRVQPSRSFSVSGVDFAGPVLTKCQHKRKASTFKSYICLFICLATKAVHLELVSSLSTDAFLATLRRFIGRRGKPAKIISDCASNFRKASKELREAYKFVSQLQNCHQVTKFISNEDIVWIFNPPAAPHFGGIWESNIKCVKYHLKRVIGSAVLTFEEFTTLLVQVEACLNSRPLCPMSSDPNDLQALTPGHFLINAPLVSIPESDLTDISMSRLKRWKLVQQLQQNLWKRWSMEYITTLQQKAKWFHSTPNLKLGDLVIIKDENMSPCSWKIGRVSDIHPGSDGRVRVVTVTTSTGQLKRPITKLCPLPDEHYIN